MKQFGTPINSLNQGISMFTLFGALGIGSAYHDYSHNNSLPSLMTASLIAISGLIAYNTTCLYLSGDVQSDNYNFQ